MMNPKSILGQVLLWGGFLSGSLATVFSTEQAEKWETINWTWYIASAVVCAIGIVFLRLGKKHAEADTDTRDENYSTLPQSMESVLAGLKTLRKDQHSMPPSKIVKFIEDHFNNPLREFADARESMISKLGLQGFADVMTQFASGERAVNRAWSAAADGYVDEVETCLERAEGFFQHAHQMLTK